MSRESKFVDQITSHKDLDNCETIEIMPGVQAKSKHVSWFVSRMFNPEDNLWIWLRRIANILTFPILILMVIQFFRGA